MSVTERLMGLGSWSVTLRDDTPLSVLARLNVTTKLFSHVLITPIWVDPNAVSAASLLGLARYSGVYRKQEHQTVLSGPGPAMWLGDEDDKGDLCENAGAGIALSGASFATSVAAVRPASLTAGTVTAIAGSYTQSWLYKSPRLMLDMVCDFFGGEWRVNPNFTLDAGPASSLFVTTPTAVALRKGGGKDLTIDGLRALELTRDSDGEDFTERVIIVGNAGVGAASSGSTAYKDPQGATVAMKRLVESSEVDAGNETVAAQAVLNRFSSIRREARLVTDEYDVGGTVKPGDYLYVYDVEQRLFNTANQIPYRGQTIYPISLRCYGSTWPVERGMGVYFRDMTSGSAVIIDLTEYVQWETGAATLEVGASPRGVTTNGGPRS